MAGAGPVSGPYFAQADLENRLSAQVVKQIYDDANIGMASTDPIKRLITDACSYVNETIQPIYLPWPLVAPYPDAVVRLSLDAAEMYAARRHPEYVRHDWEKLKRVLDTDLDKLRKQQRSLGQAPPDPAQTQGAEVYADDPNVAAPAQSVFNGRMGDW